MKEFWGWLLPGCVFVACKQYQHVNVDNPLIEKYLPDIKKWQAELDECEEECQRLSDNGEHPEWHNYEIRQDRMRDDIIETLYRAGCFRVGTKQDVLHFQGLPTFIHSSYQDVKDWAESQGYDQIKMEPIKWI